jgi:plasmid stability protein
MANLTLAIDDDLLKRARIRALEQGRSVNSLLREYLESFAGKSTVHEQAVRALSEIADRANSGSGGRRWSRGDLYDRRQT